MKRAVFLITALIAKVVLMAQPLPLDYSYCGYRQSEMPIPDAPAVLYVEPTSGDCSPKLQAAIDHVAKQKANKQTGLRGAILLLPGTYQLHAPLRISTSGIILRGSGRGVTVLQKKGVDRGAAIYLEGIDDVHFSDTIDIATEKVKAGSTTMELKEPVEQGRDVMVWRPSTLPWIKQLGCDVFGGGKELGYWGWHEGDVDIFWDRTVTQADGHHIKLNAPITTGIETNYGGGKLMVYEWKGRIEQCGVENLSLVSDFDADYPYDEDHCWNGIYIANARDCWVRMADFRHFAGSAVVAQRSTSRITVEDCRSYAPVSEIGGMRRRTFYILGGQCLVQRCYSEDGIHDFAAGLCAPGPNAFVQCEAKRALGFSGSIGSWASGLLFDCVTIDGNDIKFRNLELEKYGAGWNTANSVLWQCAASGIHCYSPNPDSPNMATGCWGQMWGNGEWNQPNEHVKPWSLFKDQLEKRLGHTVDAQCRIFDRMAGDATSSPTIEQAMALAEAASEAKPTMELWIDSAVVSFSTAVQGVRKWSWKMKEVNTTDPPCSIYAIKSGHLVSDDALIVGGKHDSPWWNGRLRYTAVPKATYALTRFVPGAEGRGLTDRIDSVVAETNRSHTAVYAQNYGLWYDRRRDDHERVRRADSDVWGPFYEQPFKRTGTGSAWDGLSLYDLTQDNKWYFYRLQQFAEKSAVNSTVLLYEHYFQHNVLEAGAHWVDCPWRSVNCINGTTFPEPVPFSGDKRIFTAHLFYDTADTTLTALHRQYIRRQLDAFKDQPNVIHSIGAEFTGPLHFVRFWIDCIKEWSDEKGVKPLVALKVNKDVQDAILQDKERSKIVDIICIEQWFYHKDGTYAPQGGVNMAPRQYMRKIKSGNPRFDDVYRAVTEYRQKYPDKAVTYFAKSYPEQAWAIFMAGGSLAGVPVRDKELLSDVVDMEPKKENGCYVLAGPKGLVVYGSSQESIKLGKGRYEVSSIDSKEGTIQKIGTIEQDTFVLPQKGIFWLKRR